MKFVLTLFLVVEVAFNALAQDKPSNGDEELLNLSLEQLMNVPINSASKKNETTFEAPLSSYTITRAEINQAGASSVMEALRLAPGVIVREQSNGVYDIHIRGMEDLTRTNQQFLKTNSTTLVMIDSRPVFNQIFGGTFWETLPVDIVDVDRIEIVRGPSSPLFGPNAVTGVINIITRRTDSKKTFIDFNTQAGSLGTKIANLSYGNNITDKFSIVITANFQNRERANSDYYDAVNGKYIPLSSMFPSNILDLQYPRPNLSMNKSALNGYLTYKVKDNSTLDLSLSTQSAQYQNMLMTSNLTEGFTRNNAANLSYTDGNFRIRGSYLFGNADYLKIGPVVRFDYTVAETNAEYDFRIGSKYKITPGLNYQTASNDDAKYTNSTLGQVGVLNGKKTLDTYSAFIRTDLDFTKRFRVLAALRGDKFSKPDQIYLAYELATTYNVNSSNLIHAALTKSNNGSFMGPTYSNIPGFLKGNDNLKLFSITMVEVGYRSKLKENLQLDFDVFRQEGRNLSAAILSDPTGAYPFKVTNLPATVTQIGTTVSLNYVVNDKVQFKPFITLQRTSTHKFPTSFVSAAIDPTVGYVDSEHKYTPSYYGGFFLNYKPLRALNININSYYYGNQTQYDASNLIPGTPQYSFGQMNGKWLFNLK